MKENNSYKIQNLTNIVICEKKIFQLFLSMLHDFFVIWKWNFVSNEDILIDKLINLIFHINFLFSFHYIYTYIYIYIYIYICKKISSFFFVEGPKREKSKYFKMNKSTKRFVFFKELFILFLHTCMFPACCFDQRKYVVQGHLNGGTQWNSNLLV